MKDGWTLGTMEPSQQEPRVSAMGKLDQSRLTQYELDLEPMRGEGRFLNNQSMLACCALGIGGEVGEVVDVMSSGDRDVLKELGDVHWYVTTAAHRTGYCLRDVEAALPAREGARFNKHCTRQEIEEGMTIGAGLVCDRIKKYLFHGSALDRAALLSELALVFRCVKAAAEHYGRDLAAVQDANVAKLRKRFPNGFNGADAALKRDETPANDTSKESA